MKPIIEIFHNSHAWIARFPENSETAQIMGTREIETAFTLKAGLSDMLEAMRTLNPEYEVYISKC